MIFVAFVLAVSSVLASVSMGSLLWIIAAVGLAMGSLLALTSLRRGFFLLFSVTLCFLGVLFVSTLVRPESLGYWPLYLQDYSATNAARVICAQLGALAILSIFGPPQRDRPQRSLTPRQGRLGWKLSTSITLAGVLLIGLTAQGIPITVAQYASEAQGSPILRASGLKTLGVLVAIIGLVLASRQRDDHRFQWWLLVGTVSISMIWFQLLRGERSLLVGVLLLLTVAILGRSRFGSFQRILGVAVLVLSFFFLQVWGTVRSSAYDVGVGRAINQGLVRTIQLDDGRSALAQAASEAALFRHMYGHLLSVESLLSEGAGRDGESFANLLLQLPPRALSERLGIEHPPSGPVRLRQLRSHQGGLFVLAEAIWNGGLAVGLTFMMLVGLTIRVVERGFRIAPESNAALYAGAIIVTPDSLFFGLQGMARNVEIVLLVVFALEILARASRPRNNPTPVSL